MKCRECGFDNVQSDICSQCSASLDPTESLIEIAHRQMWVLAKENARFRQALEMIDSVAVSKKAGAAKQMQAIARGALGVPNGGSK